MCELIVLEKNLGHLPSIICFILYEQASKNFRTPLPYLEGLRFKFEPKVS